MRSNGAFKLLGALAPLLLAHLGTTHLIAADFFANFDDFPTEGGIGSSFTDGGINFTGYVNDLQPNPTFNIEQANATDLGPAFTGPNTLGFGGYVPGSSEGFARFKSVSFAAPLLAQKVQLDVWDLPPDSGNTLTLTGYANGLSVATTSFVMIGLDQLQGPIQHELMSLSGGPFDSFTLSSSGPVDDGYGFAILDNVRITPTPEPATIVLAAFGGFALLAFGRWRRQ